MVLPNSGQYQSTKSGDIRMPIPGKFYTLLFVMFSLVTLPSLRGENLIQVGGSHQVHSIKDIAYGEQRGPDFRKHKLDLYLPKDQKGFPVLLFVHGGGWTVGDKWQYFSVGNILARNGVGVVVVNYHLSPLAKHPDHIEDIAKAFAWTFDNIEKHGGRKDRIFVSGHSAGGHLVSLLATNETYLKAHKRSVRDIRGVVAISGVFSFQEGWLDREIAQGNDWLGRKWLTEMGYILTGLVLGNDKQVILEAAPLSHVNGGEPPFLILYGKQDLPGCEKMSRDFCKALREKKVEAYCEQISNRTHHAMIARAQLSEADPVTQALLGFISSHSELILTPRSH